jgi:pimeloyl-ACP methyl ester carboxylesterase
MPIVNEAVRIPAGDALLPADIVVPERAEGIVVFAHGSGSSRHSVRNLRVAEALQRGGLGTVLVDLLTTEEEALDARTGELRFDIQFLASRVVAIVDRMVEHDTTRGLGVGLFGASTGAAAALVAAARRYVSVQTVVSRGGRPDLAGPALGQVHQPVLLIVGSRDDVVFELNRRALTQLRGDTRLEIVPGATHLFEEAGALERVADLAVDWFRGHLHLMPPGHLIVDDIP